MSDDSSDKHEDSDQFSSGIDFERTEREEFISSVSDYINASEFKYRRIRSRTRERFKRVSPNEKQFTTTIECNDQFGGTRTMHGFGSEYPSTSRGNGSGSRKISTSKNYKKKKKTIEQHEEISSSDEESSQSLSGSPSRQFFRYFGANVVYEYVSSDNEEIKIRRTDGNAKEGFASEEGVQQFDMFMEDNFENNNPQTEREKGRRFILECFQNYPPRFRIIHDVFTIQNERYSDTNISRICESSGNSGRSFKGAIFWVCNHANDHLHVIHDCSYNGNTCRCQRIKEIRGECGQPRLNRRLLRSADISSWHWINLAIYFESDERKAIHFEIAGRMWLQCGKTRNLSIRKNLQFGKEVLVETCGNEDDIPHEFQCRSHSTDSEQNPESSNATNNQNRRSSKRNKGDKLLEFFWRFPTAPINNIFNNSVWFTSPWKYLPLNNTHIRAVQRIYQRQLCDMNFMDFVNRYKYSEVLYFNCGVRDVNDYYYTTDQSLRIATDLLLFQFNNNLDRVQQFLKDLFNLLDRITPKKNCMFILSPPNAGKNYFFDAVIHFFLNFGQIGNFNRYNNFPLMECVNRRIILWNEPHCETSAFETIKMLFGGDTLNVKVKFQDDAIVNRTPCIVLSNNDIFPKDTAFRTRMYNYVWRSCDALKRCKKKLYPLCIPKLFIQFNIINDIGYIIEENNTSSNSDSE
ncbi:MAG: putative nonstructural protein [SAfia-400D ambidensovirus]|uniref:Nonstructural protein n=1 Tax=SAfia-400D ambidensovirus TaxID=3070157 RepID=A0A8K1X2W6_9VIRU|nr:MAG: putative nonstructural protein [Ambidensovirus sp.]UGV24202.1 MAG: putative nonstructural protein [SAfia-400D ambidensovirus]